MVDQDNQPNQGSNQGQQADLIDIENQIVNTYHNHGADACRRIVRTVLHSFSSKLGELNQLLKEREAFVDKDDPDPSLKVGGTD